jgi:GWxTD domain-containing protein
MRRRATFALLEIALLVAAVLLPAACGIRLAPSKDTWYTQHYIVMQNFEKDLYVQLSAEAKVQFQNRFWAFRSPAARGEFETRLSYVMTAFKKENSQQPWNTDRARIFLLNGSPVSIDYQENEDWAGGAITDPRFRADRSDEDIGARLGEVWTYTYEKYLVSYMYTFRKPGEWRLLDRMTGNQFRGELETRSREKDYGISDLEAYRAEIEKLKKKNPISLTSGGGAAFGTRSGASPSSPVARPAPAGGTWRAQNFL